MRAAVLRRVGGPPVLGVEDGSRPESGPRDVYVHAASVDPIDCEVWSRRAPLCGRLVGHRVSPVMRRADAAALERFSRRLAVDSIRSVVDQVYPLVAVAESHTHSEMCRAHGTNVNVPGGVVANP